MKKSKRTLCALLSVLLLLMLGLAACSPAQEGPADASAPPAPASAAPGATNPPADKKTYDEHLTLTWLMAGIKSPGPC